MTIIVEIDGSVVDEMHPQTAWNAMRSEEDTVLVDVRTSPEWTFTGKPDLSRIGRDVWFVEWKIWPNLAANLGFISDLQQRMDWNRPPHMFFMCRAGPRAVAAAQEFCRQMRTRGVQLHCTNILHGFEGEKDQKGQRGKLNGWKAENLPWTQD